MNDLVIMLNSLQLKYEIVERRINAYGTCSHTLLLTLRLTDRIEPVDASYLEVFLNVEEGSAHIMNLLTVEPYLGKGYASKLLNHLINDMLKKDGQFNSLTVDDMSDRFMQNHNIYIKHGFEYFLAGLPEMVLYL
jgi:GNAT superfamily N-acetyltransferase